MRYETVMDLHTHTIASGHAYNTLREMAKQQQTGDLRFWELQNMRR